MNMTPTIHNDAKLGEIAKTVIMPGDPLRATYIADSYLMDKKLLSNIRSIPVYTGTYEGKPVTVMASGMGAPSMGIYSYELFAYYQVETIIRVGSAGGIHPLLKLRDIVIATACHTDTAFANHLKLPGTLAPSADFALVRRCMEYAEKNNISTVAGTVFSGEIFHYDEDVFKTWAGMGALAVEMESAALYINAARFGKKAVAVCTISDMIFSGEHCSPKERQCSFDNMLKIAMNLIE